MNDKSRSSRFESLVKQLGLVSLKEARAGKGSVPEENTPSVEALEKQAEREAIRQAEEARLRSLLETICSAPTAKDLRALMSASYRAGRYSECATLLSIYETEGLPATAFVERTRELLSDKDIIDLAPIFTNLEIGSASNRSRNADDGSDSARLIPRTADFVTPARSTPTAWVVDLAIRAFAAEETACGQLLELQNRTNHESILHLMIEEQIVILLLPIESEPAADVSLEVRWEDGGSSTLALRPTPGGEHTCLSAAFTAAGGSSLHIQLKGSGAGKASVDFSSLRALGIASESLQKVGAEAKKWAEPPGLTTLPITAEQDFDNNLSIEDRLEKILASTYSTRMAGLLIAAEFTGEPGRELGPADRHRLAQWLAKRDEAATLAYETASRLYYSFRELRISGEIARTLLEDPNAKQSFERQQRLVQLASRALLLERQPAYPSSASGYEPRENHVLYCLHQAYPTDTNGYAVRSHALLKALRSTDWSVEGVTRPGYGERRPMGAGPSECDGLPYHVMPGPDFAQVSEWHYIHAAADRMHELFTRERPAIVHAASSFANAWPAMIAARRSGVPFVYEVRGFWEMSLAAREPWAANSEAVQLTAHNDTRIAKEADAVLVLTEAMKSELVSRGVGADKIKVAPNAVDVEDFPQEEVDRKRLESLGLDPSVPTIGYVGSVVGYEGLVLLVKALGKLVDRGLEFNLLLVGDGSARSEVEAAIERCGLGSRAKLTGRVPRDKANALYGLIDICPFPRLPLPVTEFVSPLKPFEAMAQSKVVVASDVTAMTEFMIDGENGRLFAKGDVDSLANVLAELLENPSNAAKLGERSRAWVADNRRWDQTAEVIISTYRDLAGAKAKISSAQIAPLPYRTISHRQPADELAVQTSSWFTLSGKAAPYFFGSTAPRIAFWFSSDDGPVFPTSEDATAAGFSAEPGGALKTYAAITRDGVYQTRFRLPAADAPYRIEWGPEADHPFITDTPFEIEADPLSEPRILDKKLDIAIIADPFTTAALSQVAHCIALSRTDYRAQLEDLDVDLFLCESAWHGNDDDWHRGVGYYSEVEAADLRGILDLCRQEGIPTVFFNKEDPVHFERFKKTAARFDHVVTTDLETVPSYLRLPHSRIRTVTAKPFFANPAVHHPFGDEVRQNDFCYAGTYYGERYAERTAQLNPLLEAAAETKRLVIYDRYSGVEETPYVLPDRLAPFARKPLDYQEMLDAYRRHGTFLNANSVPDSHTMFSRRVVEGLASGAAIITAQSKAVRKQLHGRVPAVKNETEANLLLTRIERNPGLRQFFATSGMRVVLRELTTERWLAQIALNAGYDLRKDNDLPTYTALVPRSSELDDKEFIRLIDELATQSYAPAGITVLEEKKNPIATVTRSKVERLATDAGIDLVFSNDKNVDADDTDFVVKVDPDKSYGAWCIENLLVLSAFGPADRLIGVPFNQAENVGYSRRETGVRTGAIMLERRNASGDGDILAPLISCSAQEPKATGRTLLIAGHDLKFIRPFIPSFEDAGFQVLVDQWEGHGRHSPEKSLELLKTADIVFCEWMLGNAKFYAEHVRPDQSLIGRLHLQELITDFPRHLDEKRFDRIFYVGKPTMEKALRTFGWQRSGRDIVMGNGVDMKALDLQKADDARFALGFVGLVPSRKRIDRALDILSHVRREDPRFHLRIKGRKPSEYSWLKDRPDEARYFERFWDRIKTDSLLRGAIRFDGHGSDMPDWFSKIGFALSTSDFESFHFTVADGAASRAIPVVLPWEGADEIYPSEWIKADEKDAADAILEAAATAQSWCDAGAAARTAIEDRYAFDDIAERMIRQMMMTIET